jgi:hypothetical protein
MYKTKNDIPEQTRTAAVMVLNARLADAVDLMHQANDFSVFEEKSKGQKESNFVGSRQFSLRTP